MIHGPCGRLNPKSPCMINCGSNNHCSKGFPKEKQDDTSVEGNSFPKYRKRCLHDVSKWGISLSDEWVVPYNPFLLSKYDAHINVEICASIKSYKHIYKYICKAADYVVVEVRSGVDGTNVTLNHDEIDSYVKSRYISSSEGAWRVLI